MTVRGAQPKEVGLAGASALVGYSYDHLQRNWRAMAKAEGFPPPYIGRGKGQHPRWLTAAIEAWKAKRSGDAGAFSNVQLAQPDTPKPAANDARAEVFSAADDPVAALLAAAGG